MPADPVVIRASESSDLPTIASIYRWHVLNGSGTFEIDPPDEAEMARRRNDVLSKGFPWLVVTVGGAVRGYAYANQFRPRPAYRHCLENSIYLAPEAVGRGLGRLLLAELNARCEALGARQMLAVIGDSANAASIDMHLALGFVQVGLIRSAGWKFGRWLDVVLMQKALGLGDATPAPGGPHEP